VQEYDEETQVKEMVVHKEVQKFVQDMWEKHGITINQFTAEWVNVFTHREKRKIATSVKLTTTTDWKV